MWRWAPKNWCFWAVVLEKTLESPLDCKEIQPVPPKGNLSWVFIGRTDAEAETPIILPPDGCEELTHLKRPCCWERLMAGGEGDDRGWAGWMASLTQWTWVWVSSGSWWWTGRPDMLQSMGLQRVRHDWVTELNWTEHVSHDIYLGGLFQWLSSKESACNVGTKGGTVLIPVSERCPAGGHGNPLSVFLPGESHEQRNLAGYSP